MKLWNGLPRLPEFKFIQLSGPPWDLRRTDERDCRVWGSDEFSAGVSGLVTKALDCTIRLQRIIPFHNLFEFVF